MTERRENKGKYSGHQQHVVARVGNRSGPLYNKNTDKKSQKKNDWQSRQRETGTTPGIIRQ